MSTCPVDTWRGLVFTGKASAGHDVTPGVHTRNSMKIKGCLPPFLSLSLGCFPDSPRKPEPAFGPSLLPVRRGNRWQGCLPPLQRNPEPMSGICPQNEPGCFPIIPRCSWQLGFCITKHTAPLGPRRSVHEWPPPPATGVKPTQRCARIKEFQGSSQASRGESHSSNFHLHRKPPRPENWVGEVSHFICCSNCYSGEDGVPFAPAKCNSKHWVLYIQQS